MGTLGAVSKISPEGRLGRSQRQRSADGRLSCMGKEAMWAVMGREAAV